MEFIFTPEHVVINDLFTRDIKYNIPDYQRPYSWDCIGKSDKNNQINVMWDDIVNFYESKEKGEYFFGSMVLIETSNRQFQVIDGQQRLTSINILFAAIKGFVLYLLKNKKTIVDAENETIKQKLIIMLQNDIDKFNEIIYNTVDYGFEKDRKLKIEKFSGFDYDEILHLTLECKSKESANFSNASDEQIVIASRYFDNRDFFIQKLKERFIVNGKYDYLNRQELSKFFDFIKNQISVVRIKTPKFDIAYQIFEILNNRGLPLSNKDLLRNFIIKEFEKLKKDSPKFKNLKASDKWIYLDQNYTLDTDFIGRFVENRKASQQKYSAFNDLLALYKNYNDSIDNSKIENLYEDLKQDLNFYTMIVENLIENKEIKNKILFLINSGNERYILNLLIALFRAYDYDGNENIDLKEFINTFEIYVINILLNPISRFSNAPIYNSIEFLNKKDFKNAINEFKLENSEIKELKILLNGNIKDNFVAKLLLAKYLWYQEIITKDDVVEQFINFDKATLEHIIPQKPENNSNWITDFSDNFRNQFTYKLGNMTILTRSLNSKSKNLDFKIKKVEYLKTKLATTQNIAKLETINENYFENRQNEIVKSILDDLKI